MYRFIANRAWTFILALFLGLGCIAVLSAPPTHAASGGTVMGSGDDPMGGAPPSNGDPDVPIGAAGKWSDRGSVSRTQPGQYGVQTVGDGPSAYSALMWRLQIVLRAMLGVNIRF